ncbi:hypothetical protein [Sphingomonas baiyangensis]|uniref:DUF2163 domain-containing protein n=1 Tax=Sphingomonas baiyangensis TaxID=2572576 RepID=A0A4U1L2G8_9SPHN|nr:hypothetical protein [Sphingomonas baiyangensis]TKD50226.1 hypothetical protein FBR43_05245 [Sphingomonas baiyangensis]
MARRSIVFRLASDPVCYLWSGHFDLPVSADALDPEGAIYKGAGELLSVPALKQLINGAADRLDFVVSGVSAETIRLAGEDRDSVKGALVTIGYVEFDADWQIVGPASWDWRGIADTLATSNEPTDNGRERQIILSVRSTDTRRSNPAPAYYTDADQRKRSPTDAIFSEVAGISVGVTRRFGPR